MNTDGKKDADKQGTSFGDIFLSLLPFLGAIAFMLVFNAAMVVGLQTIDSGLEGTEVSELVCKTLVIVAVEFVCLSLASVIHRNQVVPIIICIFGYILTQHFSLVTRLFNFIIGLFGQGESG